MPKLIKIQNPKFIEDVENVINIWYTFYIEGRQKNVWWVFKKLYKKYQIIFWK